MASMCVECGRTSYETTRLQKLQLTAFSHEERKIVTLFCGGWSGDEIPVLPTSQDIYEHMGSII